MSWLSKLFLGSKGLPSKLFMFGKQVNMSSLQVKITKRRHDGKDMWEGVVSLPNTKPTKLTKSKSQETAFGTRGAVVAAAEKFAERFNFTDGIKVSEAGARASTDTAVKASKTVKTTTKKAIVPFEHCNSYVSPTSM